MAKARVVVQGPPRPAHSRCAAPPAPRPASTYSPPSHPHAGDGGVSGVGGALVAALARLRRASPLSYFTLTPSLLILIPMRISCRPVRWTALYGGELL